MIKIDAKNVDFYYGDFHALKNISMEIEPNTSTAFIRTVRLRKVYFPPPVQPHE